MMKVFTLIWLLNVSLAQGFQSLPSTEDLLAQTDIVVVGKLSEVKEWIVGDVAYGEGVVQVLETLNGVVPDSRKVRLHWANNVYQSEAVRFSDTKGAQFVWFLWRAQDGSFRARYSNCQTPLAEKMMIIAAIQKQKAEQGGADQPATAPKSKPEGKAKPQTESKAAPR